MTVTVISDEDEMVAELQNAEENGKIVIIDFTATWCGPCKKMAPLFESLSKKYKNAVFLKVDVDTCGEIATQFHISSMPTFIFLIRNQEIERITGADPERLERLVHSWSSSLTALSLKGEATVPGKIGNTITTKQQQQQPAQASGQTQEAGQERKDKEQESSKHFPDLKISNGPSNHNDNDSSQNSQKKLTIEPPQQQQQQPKSPLADFGPIVKGLTSANQNQLGMNLDSSLLALSNPTGNSGNIQKPAPAAGQGQQANANTHAPIPLPPPPPLPRKRLIPSHQPEQNHPELQSGIQQVVEANSVRPTTMNTINAAPAANSNAGSGSSQENRPKPVSKFTPRANSNSIDTPNHNYITRAPSMPSSPSHPVGQGQGQSRQLNDNDKDGTETIIPTKVSQRQRSGSSSSNRDRDTGSTDKASPNSSVNSNNSNSSAPVDVLKLKREINKQNESKAQKAIRVKKKLPLSAITILLADDTKTKAYFNLSQPVSKIREFIKIARPEITQAFSIMTFSPNKEITDENVSIKDAQLINSVLVQKLK